MEELCSRQLWHILRETFYPKLLGEKGAMNHLVSRTFSPLWRLCLAASTWFHIPYCAFYLGLPRRLLGSYSDLQCNGLSNYLYTLMYPCNISALKSALISSLLPGTIVGASCPLTPFMIYGLSSSNWLGPLDKIRYKPQSKKDVVAPPSSRTEKEIQNLCLSHPRFRCKVHNSILRVPLEIHSPQAFLTLKTPLALIGLAAGTILLCYIVFHIESKMVVCCDSLEFYLYIILTLFLKGECKFAEWIFLVE